LRTIIFLAKFSIFWLMPGYVVPVSAQQKPGKSRFEKHWAMLHPFCALKINSIYKKNLHLYDISYLQSYGLKNNCDSETDAFRHVFFMALFAQKCSAKKILKLGKAHEKKNYECFIRKNCTEPCPPQQSEDKDVISIRMDLYNNILGIILGKTFPDVSPEMMRSIVIDYIRLEKVAVVSGNRLYLPAVSLPKEISLPKNYFFIDKKAGNPH